MAISTSRVLLQAWNTFMSKAQTLYASYGAIKIIESEHERIHAGKMFEHSELHAIGIGDTLVHLFRVNSEEIHLGNFDFISDQGPMVIELYGSPYVDASSLGSIDLFFNKNRSSSYVSSTQLYEGTYFDVNSAGTKLGTYFIEASAGGPIKSISGQAQATKEWVLEENTDYMFVLSNSSGNIANINVLANFYEP